MSWIIGNQCSSQIENVNSYILSFEGELSDIQARVLLAKFLRQNIGLTLDLFGGIKLLPIQEIALRGILLRDNSLITAARGFSKSFLASVLSILLPIFFPGTGTTLLSVNFRQSRKILEEAERFLKPKKAELLRHCFPRKMSRLPDKFEWRIDENGSSVFSLPLSTGEGLRGTRSNHLLLDESKLISKEIQENIVKPFLSARANLLENMDLIQAENDLIKRGLLKENDRISYQKNKLICFSSASYRFEYLFEMFQSYIQRITDQRSEGQKQDKTQATYFVMRASYKSLPENTILDLTQIKAEIDAGAENTDWFRREYNCEFTDSNDGYFNVKKMHDCTIKDGDFPTVEIKGNKDDKYILSIDPAYGENKSNDFFAMALFKLIPQNRSIVQCNTYGFAGKEIIHHYQYLTYLLTYFNVVYGVIDASGDEFIKGYNESVIAKEKNLKLNFLDVDFESDNYLEELSKAKTQYNITSGKIMYAQKFQSEPIRRMNEHLQNQISAEKVWFASRICSNTEAFNRAKDIQLPYKFKDKNDQEYNMLDFLEDQDIWIKETKAQCALIEVKSSATGILQYDLPNHIKRQTGDNRPRKDNYTTLLLATYAAKHYFDMMFTEVKPIDSTFTPFFAN